MDTLAPIALVDRRPVGAYLATQAPSGRRVQRAALTTIAGRLGATLEDCPWHTLRAPEVQVIRATLAEAYKPSTANRMLRALRGVLKQCWLLGLLPTDDWQRIQEVGDLAFEAPLSGRALTPGEVDKLLEACKDGTSAGVRDGAIVSLLYLGGLRLVEPTLLDLGDVDMARRTLRAKTKRRKVRDVALVDGLFDWLAAWLSVRGSEPGPLFYRAHSRTGALVPERMSSRSVDRLWRKRAKLAGLKRTSPHDARRSLATNLLKRRADPLIVARIGGWKSVQMVMRYDQRPDQDALEALERLSIAGPD